MVRYQIVLSGAAGAGVRLPAQLLSDLLRTLAEGNLRVLRLRIEGRSRPGRAPQWLREAASFELVGLSSGSLVLTFEAPPLRGVLPLGLLGLLGLGLADEPCVALLAESLAAALADGGDSVLYDEGLLATFGAFAPVFALGFEVVSLRLPAEAPGARPILRREDIEKIERLRRESVASELPMELTGDLVAVNLVRRSYTLRADAGPPVEGFADDLIIDQLGSLFGKRVTISGKAVMGRDGAVRRLLAEAIHAADEAPVSPGASSIPRAALARLSVHGFKSIRALDDLRLGRMNVLIGANGAGKSNLVSLFKLLEALASSGGTFPTHVARAGGAGALLHDGAATTPEIRAELTFQTEAAEIDYAIRLVHGASDALIFAEERYRSSPDPAAPWVSLGAGHRESNLHRTGDPTARLLLGTLRRAIAYQFHDTSETARIRQRWSVSDGRALRADAANLAPFLLRLRESRLDAYTRIVETIRQIAPFFADFSLEPVQGSVMLEWRERDTDVVFQPHQSSDGTLRMTALVALLMQPYEDLPPLLIVDEPELGLHPHAISILAGLFRSASVHAQLLLATQSTTFLDQVAPDEVVVVDRPGRASHFRRLDPESLAEWLSEYSLGELWEKNVLGGRPSR